MAEANITYKNFCMNGLILPTSVERNWSIPLRAFLYLIGLLYSFVGIAIIADVFMCAIERITSTTMKIRIPNDGDSSKKIVRYKEVLVWNPTVANLSLMAFGSSAPEILLSIIELIGNNFQVGELGPGTIVGSAAFNLMVINAICIASIPNGQKKEIDKISVYCVTAFWNVFAYLWLLFILIGTSKDEIEIWEGALTFAFFFMLILSAYIFDKELYKKCFMKRQMKPKIAPVEIVQIPQIMLNRQDIEIVITDTDMDENTQPSMTIHPEWREFEKQATLDFPNAQEEELAKVIAMKINAQRPKDYLEHRIDAIRILSKSSTKESFSEASDRRSERRGSLEFWNRSKLEFACRVYGIDPHIDKTVQLKVVRRGFIGRQVTVKYETLNGGAKGNIHFVPKSGTLEFDSIEKEKLITIDLIAGARWTTGDLFTVKLEAKQEKMKLGKCHTAEVIFIGTEFRSNSTLIEIEFVKHSVNVKFNDGYIRVPVVRKGGIKQKVSVDWMIEGTNDKKGQGSEFEGTIGNVTFKEGEIETYFDIPIVDRALVGKNKMFFVKLINPSPNASIGQTSVTMVNNDGLVRVFNKIDTMVPKILRSLEPGKQSWQEQFYQYLNVNGGDTMNASMSDYIGHIISFPWKVVCSFVPPPTYFGGWVTFIVALGLIGLVTAFVLDIAGTFGCLVGLDNTITAITFVALGASLPDTFASRIAAIQDKFADNAVGNVTGSNSVNVFVGLGLPWFIASIYWKAKGQKFHVLSGDIGFCVTVYAICAIVTISIILARRYLRCLGQAELGGPSTVKWTCSIVLVLIWLFYILISSLQVYGYLNIHF